MSHIVTAVLLLLSSVLPLGSFYSVDKLETEVPSLKFLKSEDLDKWEAPEEMQKNYPYYLSGFDEDNRPIWVLEFGKWDVRKAVVEKGEAYLSNLDRYVDQWVYRMLNSTTFKSTPDNPVKDVISIVNMADYSLWQLNSLSTISFLLKKTRQLRDAMLFVETGYVLNANYMAQMLVSMVRPILGKEMEKIEVYGANRETWIPVLLKKLPKSQLPEEFGGSKNFKPYQSFG